MNVSEYIVRFIEEKNTDRVFAVVGGACLWLNKALSEAEKLKTIFTNHEQAAVMAAEGYARIRGGVGFVFAINGPGMTNAVTGIAQAWVDSAPVILITGNSNTATVRFEREHNMRQYGTQDVRTDLIMQPITKKSYFVEEPRDILRIMEEAYQLAGEGRPGPICIELPINIQSAVLDPAWLSAAEEEKRKESGAGKNVRENANEKKESATEEIATLLQKIREAERPLILAGQGIRIADAVEKLRAFSEKLRIPVVTSRMGIDVMETESELFVGRPGNHGSRASHFALQTCDLLLVLGSRLAPNTTGYHAAGFSPQSRKFLVEIDPHELIKKDIQIEKTYRMDLRDFLTEALSLLPEESEERHGSWVESCLSWKKRYPIMQQAYEEAPGISTYTVVHELGRLAGEGDIILSDTGSCCAIVAQTWEVRREQRVLISGGLSAMGYWATAMGAALAKQEEQQLLVFTGDGSLQMNIQELATIAAYRLPVKLFVISNDGYQFVRMSQSSYNFKHTFGTSNAEGLPIPDIESIVKAYGIRYYRCSEKEKLRETLAEVYKEAGPLVCEIQVDTEQEVCPRIRSIARKDGSFEAPRYENLYPFLEPGLLQKELEL